MAQTSKSVQLKDKTGNYLSPVTDIASLFYDFTFDNSKIVRRFAIKDNFIVNTSFKNVNTSLYKSNSGEDPLNWGIQQGSNNLLYPMHSDNTSIFVSDVSIVPINNGKSKLRSFDVKRYDLSSIFLQYTPIDYANYYVYKLKTCIDEVSTNIHNTLQNYETHYKSIYVNKSYIILEDDESIRKAINNSSLIPGCIYALNYGSDAIKYIIGIANSSSSFSYKALGLMGYDEIFKIDTASFNMFDIRFNVGIAGHVIVTYMKDHLNNEAHFDFLNKLYIHPDTYNNHHIYNNVFLSTRNNVSIAGTFINNHVKHKVKINQGGHIINNIINSSLDMGTSTSTTDIYYSQIDSEINNNIVNGCDIKSSIICKNVSIYQSGSNNKLTLINVIICDNSSINVNSYRTFKNVYIGKNCNINIDKEDISNVHIDDNVILTSVNSSTYYTNYKIFARN